MTLPLRLSLLAIFGLLVTNVKSENDAFQAGMFTLYNNQIVRIQSLSPLQITYDNGKTEQVHNQSHLTSISDYSTIPTVIQNSIDRVLKEVENAILSFENDLKREFDDSYLEMMTACQLDKARHAGSIISEILTENRTFSLERISNRCKAYNYYEYLKVVFDQCKFYEGFQAYSDNEITKTERNAEREMRWLESSSPNSQQASLLNSHKSIILQCEKNRTSLIPLTKIIDDAKKRVARIDELYYRVYNKTNEMFLLYSKLYTKQLNESDLRDELSDVAALIDDWTKAFVKESTLRATANAESALKELNARRNPAPLLSASINLSPSKANWGEDLEVYIDVENKGNAPAYNVRVKLLASVDLKYGNNDDHSIFMWPNVSIRTNERWSQNPYRLKLPSTPFNSHFSENGNAYLIVVIEMGSGNTVAVQDVANKRINIALPKEQQKQDKPKSEGCFIATAVYGNYNHPDVLKLREFRDNFLYKYSWGRQFINWYYQESPCWADSINQRPFMAGGIRLILQGLILLMNNTIQRVLFAAMMIYLSTKCYAKYIRQMNKVL